ncbi:MAG TPA: Si-specific NAD(P)(+) transhydrogenase [Candidatus Udaeobacter sp.]|jgi:NAD(P) transhydrogenase|nr:Si-specific NAD(P)(+) transhydrogenase [Candidatus Udaeobacter sp.]
MQPYDLIVIGSGPAGQRSAVQAAKLGKRVAVIERRREVGGVCINTGTVPSKTLREAVLDLSGLRQRALYGHAYHAEAVTAEALLLRTDLVMRREREVIRLQLARNGIELIEGDASLAGPHAVRVSIDGSSRTLEGAYLVIATGTRPGIPPGISVDHERVLTSDDVLLIKRLPRSLAVVGAGVIGIEYATIFAALGIEVTLLDKRDQLLEIVDREIVETLGHEARALGVTFRLGEEVDHIEAQGDHAVIVLKSGKRFVSDMVLIAAGRVGATEALGLEHAGLTADERGRLAVNACYQTTVPHIYAVGDVIGFPALASTSSEQGRLASCHMFGVSVHSVPVLFPYGIYAIPEIAWVGASEEELTTRRVPFETGVARYREIARGQILGDLDGMLKLIVHLETRKVLGVWCIGSQATELVHIGQAVMTLEGTLEYFLDNVFNYPTLAECYKVAGYDCYNKLEALKAAPEQAGVARARG